MYSVPLTWYLIIMTHHLKIKRWVPCTYDLVYSDYDLISQNSENLKETKHLNYDSLFYVYDS